VFAVAAEEIRTRLGMSLGFAETKLRELCASGNVRSIKYNNYSEGPSDMTEPEEPVLIKPSEWAS
jgi:hypothetical protein